MSRIIGMLIALALGFSHSDQPKPVLACVNHICKWEGR